MPSIAPEGNSEHPFPIMQCRLRLAETHELKWPIPEALTNRDIELLFYPERATNERGKLPDFEYIHKEAARPGVTLSLLWAEYCTKCKQENTIPNQHTQFNEKYHAYAASKKATLRITRKPGEIMQDIPKSGYLASDPQVEYQKHTHRLADVPVHG